jgi:hypothetical protein
MARTRLGRTRLGRTRLGRTRLGRTRPGTVWRLLTAATAVGMLAAVAVAPRPAWAAVTVRAKLDVSIEISLPSCTEFLFIYTSARFDPPARADEVRVSFSGFDAPPGLAGGRALAGGASYDEFDWNFPISDFFPGVELTVKADWEAHTGNGLSRGFDSVTKKRTIPLPSAARKFSPSTKCTFETLSRINANFARDYRAAAKAVQACYLCRDLLNELAEQDEAASEYDHLLALDPPDPNFTVLPTAVVPTVKPVAAGAGVRAPVAAAANDYIRLLADSLGQARAALTTIERAQGARVAGDPMGDAPEPGRG